MAEVCRTQLGVGVWPCSRWQSSHMLGTQRTAWQRMNMLTMARLIWVLITSLLEAVLWSRLFFSARILNSTSEVR